MQKALKSLFPRLNFPCTPHFYQQLSLVLSEVYSSPNYQHKRFLNHVLTAKILHLHKQKELSIVLAQKQRKQMQYSELGAGTMIQKLRKASAYSLVAAICLNPT